MVPIVVAAHLLLPPSITRLAACENKGCCQDAKADAAENNDQSHNGRGPQRIQALHGSG